MCVRGVSINGHQSLINLHSPVCWWFIMFLLIIKSSVSHSDRSTRPASSKAGVAYQRSSRWPALQLGEHSPPPGSVSHHCFKWCHENSFSKWPSGQCHDVTLHVFRNSQKHYDKNHRIVPKDSFRGLISLKGGKNGVLLCNFQCFLEIHVWCSPVPPGAILNPMGGGTLGWHPRQICPPFSPSHCFLSSQLRGLPVKSDIILLPAAILLPPNVPTMFQTKRLRM